MASIRPELLGVQLPGSGGCRTLDTLGVSLLGRPGALPAQYVVPPSFVLPSTQLGFWQSVGRFTADVHHVTVDLLHRVSVTPLAVFLASAVIAHQLHTVELVDLDAFRETLPHDWLDAWEQYVADPASGVHPIALLALGELRIVARRQERVDRTLPTTSFHAEHQSAAAYTSGVRALLSSKYPDAAVHFHLMAAIDTKRKAPADQVAVAYAMMTYAHLCHDDMDAAAEAQQHWERLYFATHCHPGGMGERRAHCVRAALLEDVAIRVATSDIGDQSLRLVTAQQADSGASALYRSLGQGADHARVEVRLDVLYREVASIADAQVGARHPTRPDPSTQEQLRQAAAAVRQAVEGPVGENALAAVQFYFLRDCEESADRQDALARWNAGFYAEFPSAAETRESIDARYRDRFDIALLMECMSYSFMYGSMVPEMQDDLQATIRRYTILLDAIHATFQTIQVSFDSEDAQELVRFAMVLQSLEAAHRVYDRAGYRDGVDRLAQLRDDVQPRFADIFGRVGVQTYRGAKALLRPWTAAYYALHPIDLALRNQLDPKQRQRFDEAVLAEEVGNLWRQSRSPEIQRAAQEALRAAHAGFSGVRLRDRGRRSLLLAGDIARHLVQRNDQPASGARSRESGAGDRQGFRDQAHDLMAEALGKKDRE